MIICLLFLTAKFLNGMASRIEYAGANYTVRSVHHHLQGEHVILQSGIVKFEGVVRKVQPLRTVLTTETGKLL